MYQKIFICDAHPFNELYGVEETAKNLWSPIKKSFLTQRRLDIFYAGTNSLNNDNDVWFHLWVTF